ncbi:hypothetical protein QBC47DRAFT_39731 [Echria macrotheca]|uniref:Uncharacterized protein n=1 Tax=Echria macrotheca TaxID=438768 RepID=A0AAJ0BAE7_9PEZI|nr:hypothetical protein QBC47DRAFT_39731 [Echria macrotheca]
MPSLETAPTSAPLPIPHGELVTLIITTSPTPSAPSTELLTTVLDSFRKHCPDLTACRVILVIDMFDRIADAARLKKGQVTADGAHKFAEYKDNVKRLILDEYRTSTGSGDACDDDELLVSYGAAEFGAEFLAQQPNAVPLTITTTQDRRVTFIEPTQRIGFGLAVRSALRITETPYVWIQQHDWSLIADIPLRPLLDLMQQQTQKANDEMEANPDDADDRQVVTVPIKYVCFPSVRMLRYAASDHVVQFAALRALTYLYKQTFYPGRSSTQQQTGPSVSGVKIPLTPLFLWHDKPHLAETKHYLARVFPTRLAMARGSFIEDTVGHRARDEMKRGEWKKWACWLYYPCEGKELCVRHLKGRTFRGAEAELVHKLESLRIRDLGRDENRMSMASQQISEGIAQES